MAAVRDGVGVGIAVGLSGLAFGAAAVSSGLTVVQACLLSLLTFSGASQFALAGAVAGGGNVITGALGAVALGGRNALYGLRLAPLLGAGGWRRLLTAHFVIDESTAVATAQPTRGAARAGFWATAFSVFAIWNLTTLLGGLGANWIGDPGAVGLDVVGPAAFLALLWPRLRGAANAPAQRVALVAVGVALAATPFLPPGVPVMIAAVAALAGIRRQRESVR